MSEIDFVSTTTRAGRIDVKIKPSMRKVKSTFQKRLREIKDATIPNKQAAIYLDRWVQLNFRSEGGPMGGWRPISRQGKILQDTGRLRLSFIPFANKRDAGIGSELPYSKFHDKGLGKMPKRQILPDRGHVEGDLWKIYDKYVEGLTKERLW